MEEYPVRLINMPTTIHSFVRKKDGIETIVINSRLSRERQELCYMHEIEHINRNDLGRADTADHIETQAHGNT